MTTHEIFIFCFVLFQFLFWFHLLAHSLHWYSQNLRHHRLVVVWSVNDRMEEYWWNDSLDDYMANRQRCTVDRDRHFSVLRILRWICLMNKKKRVRVNEEFWLKIEKFMKTDGIATNWTPNSPKMKLTGNPNQPTWDGNDRQSCESKSVD